MTEISHQRAGHSPDDPSPDAWSVGRLVHALGAELTQANSRDVLITGVAAPASAGPGLLVFAADAATLQEALAGAAAAVLTTPGLSSVTQSFTPLLLVANPRLAFARAARLLRSPALATGIHPQADVSPGAVLGRGVSVGAFAVVEAGAQLADGVTVDAGCVVGAGCVLGAGARLYPRVVLYPGVRLGARGVVHAGAVLGADGFGYVRDPADGSYTQTPQQGGLVIEEDVEIGANSTVDRGALKETRIGRGVKIDNLVHIGHNVEVGEHVVIAAQTGVSGSSTIGAGAVVAGQVGIADHVTIGPGAILGAQCGVPSNKQIRGPGVLFWGTPARPIAQYLKELAVLARLTRGSRDRAPKAGEGAGPLSDRS